MTRPSTIAVAYAAVGSGHRTAAEAVAAELGRLTDAAPEVVDALDFARPRLSGDKLASTFTGPTGGVYDAVWSRPGLGWVTRKLAAPAISMVMRDFTHWLGELKPDIVVATHALPSTLAIRACRRGRLDCRVVNVATDYGIHGFWTRRGVDLFCVGDDESAEELFERGYARGEIAVTGIPVRRQFTLEYDIAASRHHFDLPLDHRVVLAIAGSALPGSYLRLKESLSVSLPALASLPDTTVVIVCGRDEDFAEELRARAAGFGTTNVRILGYTEHMAPLMACADLIIAKPGGAVCAESLATGVPLLLLGPAVGQERANAEKLARLGTAVFAADPRTLAEHARKALYKPARLTKMKEAAVASGRPFAAADAAERIVQLLPAR